MLFFIVVTRLTLFLTNIKLAFELFSAEHIYLISQFSRTRLGRCCVIQYTYSLVCTQIMFPLSHLSAVKQGIACDKFSVMKMLGCRLSMSRSQHTKYIRENCQWGQPYMWGQSPICGDFILCSLLLV